MGELARELKDGTWRAVREVLILKKQRGKFRRLGIPCRRVAQTAAMLVLAPIFEADLHESSMPIGGDKAHKTR